MEQRMIRLVAAHHPKEDFLLKYCDHYYCDRLSIAVLKKSPAVEMVTYNHAHDEYEFLIPLTPVPVLMIDDALYFGEVGYVYPIQSAHEHGVKFKASDISYDHIVIDQAYMDAMIRKKGYEGKEFSGKFEESNELKSYIQLFKNECAKGKTCDHEKMDYLSALITMTLVDNGLSPTASSRKESHKYQKGIASVAAYINQHYKDDMDVDLLAKMCGLTKNYFISAFRKAMGETPYSYLCKLRISKAKVLLETTEDSIQSVAMRCGFKKSNTFTTLFKSVTGQTPSEYRKASKNS